MRLVEVHESSPRHPHLSRKKKAVDLSKMRADTDSWFKIFSYTISFSLISAKTHFLSLSLPLFTVNKMEKHRCNCGQGCRR